MTVAVLDGGKSQRLHAVVLPYPAKGHSIPLLHFAERLDAMGVTVTFVNAFNHLSEEVFRSLIGLEHASMRVVALGDSSVQPGGGTLPYLRHVESLEAEAELLLESLFDCIVTDMFLGWTQVINLTRDQLNSVCPSEFFSELEFARKCVKTNGEQAYMSHTS
jgi:hypothetical protein